MHGRSDTIVALSSAPGRSPRALIRLSGNASFKVLASLAGVGVDALPPPRVAAGLALDLAGTGDRLTCVVARFAGPRSFTGEDMVEVQLPGNPALIDRVLARCAALGATLAEGGEFSFRAFVNRKIDLTQAEGIAATIASQTDAQLAAAAMLRQGRLGAEASALVGRVAEALALVEAGIDFTDQDDVVPISPRELLGRLEEASGALSALLARSRSWGALRTLPRVALVGAPSVGKSTLFNAMLARDRAVTSPTPGTTRDVLEEPIELPATPASPLPSRAAMLDLAGLDEPGASLDRDVQAAAREAIASADLVLLVSDGAGEADFPDVPRHGAALHVLTKCDGDNREAGDGTADRPLRTSAKTGAGLGALKAAIADALASRGAPLTGQALALQPRHEEAIRRAIGALGDAIARVSPQREGRSLGQIELVAGALREALDSLACLGGVMTPDDVIGLVFSRFCVGK